MICDPLCRKADHARGSWGGQSNKLLVGEERAYKRNKHAYCIIQRQLFIIIASGSSVRDAYVKFGLCYMAYAYACTVACAYKEVY